MLCCATASGAAVTAGLCTGAASSSLVLLPADTPIAGWDSSACACFIGRATDAPSSAVSLPVALLLTLPTSPPSSGQAASASCGTDAEATGVGAKSVSSSAITSSSACGTDDSSCCPGAACAVGDGDGAGSTASSSRAR